jgi:hypothetical protein
MNDDKMPNPWDVVAKKNPGSKIKEIMFDARGELTDDDAKAVRGRITVVKDGIDLYRYEWR